MSAWNRAIIHVDMNAFFASVEQRDYPALKGRPIGVTNGLTGTCVITSSYEARRFGVKTGMRVREARRICPGFIQSARRRPEVYARTSTTIMESFLNITPDVEVFSCDEAFLDITRVQKLHGDPIDIARKVKQHVYYRFRCELLGPD